MTRRFRLGVLAILVGAAGATALAGHRTVIVPANGAAESLPFTGTNNLPLQIALGSILVGLGVGATRLGRAQG